MVSVAMWPVGGRVVSIPLWTWIAAAWVFAITALVAGFHRVRSNDVQATKTAALRPDRGTALVLPTLRLTGGAVVHLRNAGRAPARHVVLRLRAARDVNGPVQRTKIAVPPLQPGDEWRGPSLALVRRAFRGELVELETEWRNPDGTIGREVARFLTD